MTGIIALLGRGVVVKGKHFEIAFVFGLTFAFACSDKQSGDDTGGAHTRLEDTHKA